MQHPVLVALVCILFLLYLTQPSSGISSLVASNSEDSLAVEVQAYASFEDETTTLLEQEIEIMLDSQHKIQLEGNAKPSEEQDLDRARKAGAPTLGTNGAWKRVPVNPSGPNAKLVAALHRVSGEIFKALNDNMTTGPKYTKCTKFGEVMMKSSTGIEYKFRCEALFTNQVRTFVLFRNMQLSSAYSECTFIA